MAATLRQKLLSELLGTALLFAVVIGSGGLVNEVVPAESLHARAQEILDAIGASAPIANRLAMEAVNRGADAPLPQALALERSFFGICASSADKGEGTSAFLAKRKPVFQAR